MTLPIIALFVLLVVLAMDSGDELPDSKIPWWDNEYEGVYSEDPEDGYPYDMGTKVQE